MPDDRAGEPVELDAARRRDADGARRPGRGQRHVPFGRHGPVRARRRRFRGRGAPPEVRARLRDLRRSAGHDPDAPERRPGRGAHALPHHHRHARAHQGLHQPRTGHAARRRGAGRVRHRSVRDAVPGRRAATVRRGALAPARPQARFRLHLDGVVDRREAVGVCLRRVAPKLPCHRGDPLRAQRAHGDSRRRDPAARRSAAHPGGVGAAGRLRPSLRRAGTRSHPSRLRSADRRRPRASRSAAAGHAAKHSRAAVDRQLHDRALHRPRSLRREDTGGLAGVRGRAWRRIQARRTLGARNLLPARSHARVPERLPDRFWRPRRLQQGRRAVAGGARSSGAGRQPVQRAGLVGHPIRAALLLVAGAGHDDRPGGARSPHRRQLFVAGRNDRLGRSGGLRARPEHDACGPAARAYRTRPGPAARAEPARHCATAASRWRSGTSTTSFRR